jgi:hypothetical protein
MQNKHILSEKPRQKIGLLPTTQNFGFATGKELRPESLAQPSFVPYASLGNVRNLRYARLPPAVLL